MDPSTDAVSILNHEAVVGGFARAHDVHGIEVPDRHIIILNYLMEGDKASPYKCENDTCRRDGPYAA